MAQTQIKHVYGNVLRIAIPLQQTIRTLVDGEEREETSDFYPNPNFPTNVVLRGSGTIRYEYTATVVGNVATIEDKGDIRIGTYQVEVLCHDENGEPVRYMVRQIIKIVDATIDAGIEAGIEFNVETYTLDGTVFFYAKGDKGDPFTYDDFTEEQILNLKRPALEVFAQWEETYKPNVLNATSNANDAAVLAASKAEEARLAAINAKADYVGRDNYIYHWNATLQQYEKTDINVKGDQGVSVESVEQIQTSTESEGVNIVRVTLSNGTTSDFEVRNGKAITPTFDVENKTLIFNK